MKRHSKKTCLGQAFPLILVLLAVVAGSVFYMFNTGQIVQEKMRLTNTADAVAYSAGVYEARVLNYDAYTNRAIIANEIAIGHAMGLASWGKYSATLAENLGEWASYIPGWGTAIQQALDAVAQAIVGVLDVFKFAAVTGNEVPMNMLAASQSVMHSQVEDGRKAVMDRVAKENDPYAKVDKILFDDFEGFTQFNTGNNRERMRQTIETTRQQDGFLNSRDWNFTFGWCSSGVGFEVGFKAVGGTGLIGFDGWKSVDTMSAHVEEGDGDDCDDSEEPLGYGSSFSADNLADDYAAYGRSEQTNPEAHDKAFESDGGNGLGGKAWDDAPPGLGGRIPSHWGLSDRALNSGDPRTQIAIRVTKAADKQRYSGGGSVVKPAGKLKRFDGQHKDKQSASIARAEVFFERPDGANPLNGRAELGSLFNPYWQVHLVPVTDDDKTEALKN